MTDEEADVLLGKITLLYPERLIGIRRFEGRWMGKDVKIGLADLWIEILKELGVPDPTLRTIWELAKALERLEGPREKALM